MDKQNADEDSETAKLDARRRFLTTCGKFAAITPPAMAVLLSSTAQNYAVAASGNAGSSLSFGNNGFGNGGGDGVPGNSGNNPSPQTPSRAADEER
ncbi:MAG: hypothetical protein A3D94_02105 [Alphaproteobacteria bacterium RIFCSPHIGHO2_12_FULL_66_14]|jgi:hypothetical protein|nr:MAG: hypothetical protein A3D94_02105 [Alphaproteobacteria bacterium RIFCSPHIGHO2_12_FULL_66_14]